MANVRVPQSTRTGAVPVGKRRRRFPLWLWLLLGLLALLLLAWLLYVLLHHSSSNKSSTPNAASSAATSTAGKSASTPTSVPGGTATPGSSSAPTAIPSGSSGGVSTTDGAASTYGAALVGGGGIAATTATGSTGAGAAQGTVLFASGSAKIDAAGMQVIRAAAARIKALHVSKVTVVGYTDVVGGQPKNDNLSAQRAAAVAAVLRQELGSATAVTTSAKGESDPVASNSTAVGRQQNRRASITSS
jgi:outer membrane protein OmpA-like peptidoglycan-associated protein